MESELRKFIERVHSIETLYIDFLGRGLPGMAGTAITTQGSSSSGTDITNKLRTDSTKFAKLLSSHADKKQVDDSAHALEGHLLALQTIGQLSEKNADELIDELHKLTDQ